MKRRKLNARARAAIPQKEGYFVSQRGDYIPVLRIPAEYTAYKHPRPLGSKDARGVVNNYFSKRKFRICKSDGCNRKRTTFSQYCLRCQARRAVDRQEEEKLIAKENQHAI